MGKSGIKIECSDCEIFFYRYSEKNRHDNEVHKKLKPWPCKHCNAKFKRYDHLNRHTISKHPDKSDDRQDHQCTTCDAKFTRKDHLKRHTISKHPDPDVERQDFQCGYCQNKYATKSGLNKHIKNNHNKDICKEKAPTRLAISNSNDFVSPRFESRVPRIAQSRNTFPRTFKFALKPPIFEPTMEDLKQFCKYVSLKEEDPKVKESGIFLMKLPEDYQPCSHNFKDLDKYFYMFKFYPKVLKFESSCNCKKSSCTCRRSGFFKVRPRIWV